MSSQQGIRRARRYGVLRQFVVTGEPLVDAAGAQLEANAGEFVLSPAAPGFLIQLGQLVAQFS